MVGSAYSVQTNVVETIVLLALYSATNAAQPASCAELGTWLSAKWKVMAWLGETTGIFLTWSKVQTWPQLNLSLV